MQYGFLTFSFVLSTLFSLAQTDGMIVFGTDQVVTVELQFDQVDFWDSLTTNYTTETEMVCAGLTITDNTGVHTFTNVNVRLKGNSSYGHPGNKKSFKIDFNDNVQGQNYDGLKKLNFNNGFKDPTFMREKIFFDVCKELSVPAPRVNFANVYMNGTFWGFYGMVEQIDDQFLDWAILDDSGNLFKAGDNFGTSGLAADLKDYGITQVDYDGRYELKTNENANDWTDLVDFIDFVNNSDNTTFGNELNNHLNKATYLRSLALDILFSNLDSYVNSARNYYLYHNMTTGQWEWIKWDGNESFGSYTGGPGASSMEQLAVNYVASDRPLIQQVFNNPTLYQEYLLEVCSILNTHFNSTYIDAKADALKDLIASHVYADANKMYSDAAFDQNIEQNITQSGGPGPGGTQTTYGIKSFVANRANYLSDAIDCSAGITEENLQELILFPNPAQSDIQLSADLQEVIIYNALGEAVQYIGSYTKGTTIPLYLNGAGMYFLTGESDGKSIRLKFSVL